MKNQFLLLVSFFFLKEILFGQPLPEQDCIAAIPVCQDIFVQTIPYSGTGNIPNEINPSTSCLSTGERHSVWYTFTIQTSGNLCFLIIPMNLSNDYDWAAFNITNAPCSDIFSNSSLNDTCNYQASSVTGASDDSTGPGYTPCFQVNSGETHVLNVSKFDAAAGGYTLDFSASTAQIYDIIPPTMQSVTSPVTCGDTQIVVNFDENIFSSSVQITDFSFTGPLGFVTITNVSASNNSTYDEKFILTISPAISPVGNYTLTLVDSSVQDLCNNTNISTNTFNFSVVPFAVQTSSTPQLCTSKNGTVTANPLGGISPYNYIWNTPVQQFNPTATGLQSGVYTVTITDSVGCISNASVSVSFDPGINPPVASISSFTNATCTGISDGKATASVTGGNSPYSFVWNTFPVQTDSTATGLGTGSYIVTVTDTNGCFDTAIVSISSGTVINISATPINDTIICNGGTATLSATVSGGTSPYSYTWLNSAGSGIPINVNPANTTVYRIFATDNIGCNSDTESVIVNVLPPIIVDIPAVNNFCKGETAQLNANATGGNSNYSYLWSNGGTGSSINISPISDSTFSVTVFDGCTTPDGTASINIIVGQPPPNTTISTTPYSDCVPFNVQFQVAPFIQGYIYQWNFGDGKIQPSISDTISHNYTEDGCMDVSLIVTTNQNFCKDTFDFPCAAKPLPRPSADFSFTPENPSTTDPVVNFDDQSSGATNWQWNFGDMQNSILQNPQHEYSDSGNYMVNLLVRNDYFCYDSVEKNIRVDFETGFFIPNCFTPDENGMNDEFAPVFEGIKPEGFKMYIFNRNGIIIFQTENPNEKWDGKIKDEFAENAVYVYQIKYKNLKNETKTVRGTVTLLR